MKAAFVACAIALSYAAQPARAVEVVLSDGAIAAAVAEGRTMAARGAGYEFGSYLLFGVDDALRIANDDEAIEAVVVGTPYERLRFQSYLLAYQRRTLAADAQAAFVSSMRGTVEFVIFAHSHGDADRDFMQHFGAGALEARGSSRAATVSHSEPVLDAYYRPSGAVLERWLGQITYRFDVRANASFDAAGAPATFSFADDRGVVRRYSLVLSQYR